MKKLYLGITEFAIPSPMMGSIEAYSGYGRLPEVGTQIHEEVQQLRAQEFPDYQAEKWISREIDHGDYTISVSGRMDGFCHAPAPWIEEIKSTYDTNKLIAKLTSSQDHPYRRQLMTYGYLYWLEYNEMPHLRFSIVNSRNRTEEFIDLELDVAEYKGWLDRRLDDIVHQEKLFEAARRRRKNNADLVFPFEEQRPGQKELVETIDERMKNGSRMMLQAPTGLGKTIGVLFPTLRNSLQRGQKLIYLTAKNSQHGVAEEAVERIQNTGADIRSLSLHSKSKMCFKEEVMCDPSYCEFAKDHYTKMEDNDLRDKLLKKKVLSEKSLKSMAEKYEVCPFELQMESTAFSDVIIGDYNYVFSPYNVRERLAQNSLGKTTSMPNLVIDEAHNLPSRGTDYFSAGLSSMLFEQLLREIYDWPENIQVAARELREVADQFFARLNDLQPLVKNKSVIELPENSLDELKEKTQRLLTTYLESDALLRQEDPIVGLFNQVMNFAEMSEVDLPEFITIYEQPSRYERKVKIICRDAAWWLTKCYKDFANVVAFSATLKPFEYYRQLMGFTEDEVHCSEFASPFSKENRKVLIIPQVSTKLRDRDTSIPKIRDGVFKIVSVRPGNYFVFFPSFEFLEKVVQDFDVPGFEIVTQQRSMNRREISDILSRLKAADHPMLVFAVQGGVFSEGVDYPGDMLIGAIIIGPALPVFNFEREQIREYYDGKFGDGFNYAYTFPAMTRTIQSAGRVIRSATDRGVIVLMDRRFLEKTYLESMPQDWGSGPSLQSSNILNDLYAFWADAERTGPCPSAEAQLS